MDILEFITNNISTVLALIATGIFAGILAGLLGVGGGIVIVPVLFFLFQGFGVSPESAMVIATATSLATIVPTSISSIRSHSQKGNVDFDLLKRWAVFILMGVLLGSWLVTRIDGSMLTMLFGVIAVLSALNMLFRTGKSALYQKLPGRVALLRILGKAENDLGNFETSFQYYTDAKELAGNTHDRTTNKMFVNAVISGVSRADYFGAPGSESESPVLVVGMPRTGSTLLEQILSSHPQIGGIGESKNLREITGRTGVKFHDGASLVSAIHKVSPDQAQELAKEYLRRSLGAQPNMQRIVDKNLHNFEILGLFAKMFPKARIINALRDPMDNCVSCYLAPLSKFHSYTQDLTSLGQYYCEFRRLMDHWKNVLPNPILEVHYEDIVADTEGKAREVIDFLGLDWDPACLDFQQNENRAQTISTWQVRQPIYKSSVKRWARYEKHLDPLKAELKQFYPDGF